MSAYRPLVPALAGLSTAAVVSVLLLVPAGSAQAQILEMACTGDSTSTYRPGLTNTPQDVTIQQEGRAGWCIGNPEVSAGTWEMTATGTLSCVEGSAAGSRTYHWDSGDVSKETVRLTVNARPQGQTVLVTEGEIVEGLFEGARTRSQAVLTSTDLLACLQHGLTSTSGPRLVQFFAP